MRVFVVLLLGSMLTFAGSCRTSGPVTAYHSGALKTGYRTWDVVDEARHKTLLCEVWYPVATTARAVPVRDGLYKRVPSAVGAPIALADHKYPLILLEPGYGYAPDSLAWLAQFLVGQGYIVAGVDHQDIAGDGVAEGHLWDHPKDISALLNSLQDSTLGSSIDPKRIGMVAYSTGALTAIWLAGGAATEIEPQSLHPQKEDVDITAFKEWALAPVDSDLQPWKSSYRDPRIKAFVLLAPAGAWLFQEKDLKHIPTDMFIIAGSEDDQVSSARNAVHFAQWIPQAQFKELQGQVGHSEFMGELTPKGLETCEHATRKRSYRISL